MQPSPKTVPIAYRAPFAFGHAPWRDVRAHGETLMEMVQSVPNLPKEFLRKGVVMINGEPVRRELWSYVRPKPSSETLPIAVTMHFPLGSQGGGGSSSKSIIALVAAIALVAVAAVLTGPFGASIVGALGLPTTVLGGAIATSTLLAGAVSIAGALAISALTAPPTTTDVAAQPDTNTDNRDPAGAQGNVIAPGGAIPRVIGTRKVFPPFICEPLVELVEEDEYVEGLVALNGPHLLEDIRVDDTDISSTEDVQLESFEGWSTDTAPTLITRQGRTITPQLTLSQHVLQSDNLTLSHQSHPTDDLPIWHEVVTRNAPDEIWIHLLFPGGVSQGGTTRYRVPFRIRMRNRGSSTWINLPEIHYSSSQTKQQRAAFLFKWQSFPGISSSPTDGFVYAHRAPTAQSATPATPTAWVADSYFDDGAGNNYYYNGNESSSRVININLFQHKVEFYLNTATFTPGIWEIQIKRGCAFADASFTNTSYQYGGSFKDFFWYFDSAGIHKVQQDQTNVSDRCLLVRVSSVWNSPPYVPTNKFFSLIAVKARNRNIQKLSVRASGYVRDWGGADWDTWTTTSNPAPHYVDVLSGEQNLDPLDTTLRDDTALVDWRQLCIDNGWTCDAIIDDMRTQDVLGLLASCGYAKPYQSDVYGVTVDNDRSAESPVQVFSRINASNVKFERAFVRAPEGFIVTYRDEESDDDRAQAIVLQSDPSIATTGLFETIAYDGLTSAAKVEARARFDLDQANLRSTFYSLDTDIESIVCRRGSLVALQHDVIRIRASDGRVMSVQLSGPNVIGITLDNEIDVVAGDTGVAIRHTDGSITTHSLSNVDGPTQALTFDTPFADDGTIVGFDTSDREYGSLVVVGPLATVYRRMLVAQITATKDLKASLVLVDEAQDLVRYSGA